MKVNRTQFGKVTDLKQAIGEKVGTNCYFPTSGNFFNKKD